MNKSTNELLVDDPQNLSFFSFFIPNTLWYTSNFFVCACFFFFSFFPSDTHLRSTWIEYKKKNGGKNKNKTIKTSRKKRFEIFFLSLCLGCEWEFRVEWRTLRKHEAPSCCENESNNIWCIFFLTIKQVILWASLSRYSFSCLALVDPFYHERRNNLLHLKTFFLLRDVKIILGSL